MRHAPRPVAVRVSVHTDMRMYVHIYMHTYIYTYATCTTRNSHENLLQCAFM
jgi:hypothetical protein